MILYELNNYNMHFKCREKEGGRILIYTRKHLNIEVINNMDFKHAENLEVEINKKIILNAISMHVN